MLSGLTQPEGITPAKDLRSHPHVDWWSYWPWTGERVKSTLDLVRTQADDCRSEHYDIACGTRHVHVNWRNLCVYEQVVSPQWLCWSTRTSETFADVSTPWKHSLCRAYIITMLHVHQYILSPATMFRVLWRTHFKIVEYLQDTCPFLLLQTCVYSVLLGSSHAVR